MSDGLPPMPRPKRRRERLDGTTATVGLAIRLLLLVGVILILDKPLWFQVTYGVVLLIAAATWWWKDAR